MNKFPPQEKPLYGFHIVDGRLVRTIHTNYLESTRNGYFKKKEYRFHKGVAIGYTKNERLDRYVNGYLYTFDPDEDRALSIIRDTVREKIEKTREDLAKLEQKMEILEAIE